VSLELGNYILEGPYESSATLEDKPGIFIVFCHVGDDYRGLDCGGAKAVRSAVEQHRRRPAWESACDGRLEYAVLYTEQEHSAVVKDLRSRFKFPCRDATQF
jgi:hypothetical protein